MKNYSLCLFIVYIMFSVGGWLIQAFNYSFNNGPFPTDNLYKITLGIAAYLVLWFSDEDTKNNNDSTELL